MTEVRFLIFVFKVKFKREVGVQIRVLELSFMLWRFEDVGFHLRFTDF